MIASPLVVPVKVTGICDGPLLAVVVSVQVVDWPGARDVSAHVTVPDGEDPAMPVTGESPVFVMVVATVIVEPEGTDGPGAEPAGCPFTVGVPTEMVPVPPPGVVPLKNAVVEPETGSPFDTPVKVIVIEF